VPGAVCVSLIGESVSVWQTHAEVSAIAGEDRAASLKVPCDCLLDRNAEGMSEDSRIEEFCLACETTDRDARSSRHRDILSLIVP
jgi:hypothetical protein